jgi:hypothetical protein
MHHRHREEQSRFSLKAARHAKKTIDKDKNGSSHEKP